MELPSLDLQETVNLVIFPRSLDGSEFEDDRYFDGWNILYSLHLYPGFYSYTEGATWKILDLSSETPLIHGFPVIRLSRPKKVA